MEIALQELARLLAGTLQGNGRLKIRGAATLRGAEPGDISLVENAKYVRHLSNSRATAVLAPPGILSPDVPAILTENCHADFVRVIKMFRPLPQSHHQGISPAASVHPTARLASDVTVLPGAFIGEHVEIGAGTIVHSGCSIMAGCTIGSRCVLFPNVVLYEGTRVGNEVIIHAGATLGAYGFGYSLVDGRHALTAQLGYVEVHDRVEIGAGTTIDRGTYDATIIGEGTKIDNQVQIGHNCRIGRHNLLCSQVGIAGSVHTGDYVVLAGQVGVRDHVDLGRGVRVGAKSGVHANIADGVAMFGIPAAPEKQQRQALIALTRLPGMRRRLRRIERQLGINAEERDEPARPEAA